MLYKREDVAYRKLYQNVQSGDWFKMRSAKHLAFRDSFVESEEVKLVVLSGQQLRALKRSPNENQVPSGHPPKKYFYLSSWPQVLFPLGKVTTELLTEQLLGGLL